MPERTDDRIHEPFLGEFSFQQSRYRFSFEQMSTTLATVLKTSRRSSVLLTAEGAFLNATSSSRAIEITVGDKVTFEERQGDVFVTEILSAKNYLERSYFDAVRRIAGNLDKLFVVTALGPLFSHDFIDRLLVAASCHGIEPILIANKVDRGVHEEKALLEHYASIGVPVIMVSAKFGTGMLELRTLLQDPQLATVALVGMSGVGKSTLLNSLIPEALRATGEVSEKTGQGKQTTSQAAGYLYGREDAAPLIVIDCPGIQRFGLGHLQDGQVSHHFPEFRKLEMSCQYGDCAHTVERNCAVLAALERGEIPLTRYASYQAILKEIVENKPF